MDNNALLTKSKFQFQSSTTPLVDYSKIISALSNVSIQYNIGVVGIALLLMDNDDTHNTVTPAYPRSAAEDSALRSAIFAGAITGQACMGYLGDVIGKGNAMIVTCIFTFIGAVLSASATWGDADQLYTILIGARFVMGIGVGGKYPLASTLRGDSTVEGEHRSTEVAKGFFWQTPGTILPVSE